MARASRPNMVKVIVESTTEPDLGLNASNPHLTTFSSEEKLAVSHLSIALRRQDCSSSPRFPTLFRSRAQFKMPASFSLSSLLVSALFLALVVFSSVATADDQLLCITNQERKKNGLRALAKSRWEARRDGMQ